MIYFVRHGESEANLRDVFAGQRDDSLLTEKGREQAKLTAQTIVSKGISVDRIVSSPLKRSYETAVIIAKVIGFDPQSITIDERITEYDMGSLTGTPLHKVSSALLTTAQEAEDPDLFYERVHNCIEELSGFQENILIVSHAGVGRMIETMKMDAQKNLFYDIPAYENASVTKLDWVK